MSGPAVHRGFLGDARWSLGIFVTRAASSLLFVVVVSRSLESAAYGLLAAMSVLTSLSAVIVTGGIAHAMTMAASRSADEAGAVLKTGVKLAILSIALVLPAYLLLCIAVLSLPVIPSLMLFGADVIVSGAAELIGSVLIGLRRFASAAVVWMVAAGTRGVAAIAIAALEVTTIFGVTLAAIAAALLSLPLTLAALRRVARTAGPAVSVGALAKQGGVFTYGNLVGRATNDFDKLYLVYRLGETPAVGTYAVGYRLVEFSCLPLNALSTAAYPRLFKAGAEGTAGARAVAKRLTLVYLGAAALISVGVAALALPLEWVFGDSYAGLSEVIWALAPWPILRAANNLLGEPLTGGGQHRLRVVLMTFALVVSAAVMVAFFDPLGWQVAIAATYASELTLLACLSTVALAQRQRTSVTPVVVQADLP